MKWVYILVLKRDKKKEKQNTESATKKDEPFVFLPQISAKYGYLIPSFIYLV